jgi:DNA-binding beta-propeller fold protein YncE
MRCPPRAQASPDALLYVAGRLWASAWNGRTRSDGVVLELNPRSLRTASEIPATDPADRSSTSEESEPFGLAAGARSVWAAVAGDLGEVIRIDQRSGRETARIPVGTSYPFAVAFADGNLWALDYFDNTLTRIDPRTNRVTGRLRVGPPRNSDNIAPNVPAGLTASGHLLWVTDEDSATLTRVALR